MREEDRSAAYCCVTLSDGDDPLTRLERRQVAATALQPGDERARIYSDDLFPDRPSYRIEVPDRADPLPGERIAEAFRLQGRDPDTVATYEV